MEFHKHRADTVPCRVVYDGDIYHDDVEHLGGDQTLLVPRSLIHAQIQESRGSFFLHLVLLPRIVWLHFPA